MRPNTILFSPFLLLFSMYSVSSLTYDLYLQLMQFQTSLRMVPYRGYDLRWEIECTTDHRQPITKFPTAFSMDDTHLVFFDPSQVSQRRHQPLQQQHNQQHFVYVRDVSEMSVVCFRLYYMNDLALEDCLVVDVRNSDFADVRYSTTTRGHGNALTYQAQVTSSNGLYQLLSKEEDNETVATNVTANNHYSGPCTAATVVASVEAFVIMAATLVAIYLYFLKSSPLSLDKLRRKRPTLGPARVQANKKTRPFSILRIVCKSKSQHSKTCTLPGITKTDQHYKGSSASSADSGLSTISRGSYTTRNQKEPVVIYDDPPEFKLDSAVTNNQTKRQVVQDYLTEMLKRNKLGNGPPRPPVPDYAENRNQMPNISNSATYDVLEDPNNWDPPEQEYEETMEPEYGNPESTAYETPVTNQTEQCVLPFQHQQLTKIGLQLKR